ncbi:type I polyketide synthase [Streptomyces hoynatensis]|uniref:Acyltransferase domain-containing protein n=1 Tax=Streptomyces hoynatensis TaxID=1141874 RepID=A0A3A9Z600_9ACTN|nr:type I polyketide synthase [Streptomyces hoynatensis]RKN43912.1 acyltransferase domain-containing protein [Streptomyces hoynatensis]
MSFGGEEAVAVVGAGCRFPGGGTGADGLWRLLHSGTDAISEVPPSRWDLERYYDPDPDRPGTMHTRWGGFLPDIERFDAAFFGISRREARQMDPQQRLLLEVAWEALEDAGIVPGDLFGSRTAVYTGGLGADYYLRHAHEAGIAAIDPWYATGKETSFASGRLSYLLGLNGPSLSLNTACSSSLIAVHLARQSLLSGESDAALVGGVSLLLAPELTVFMCKAGAMSPEGRCKAFDASADGIVRGDGCAVVVLKRLGDALADGNDVLAVIRGSAVNHDGNSAGLTVPSATAQQRLLRAALHSAGIEPGQVGYVEAHGTGTPLGDPIEAYALGDVLGKGRPRENPLLIGSVKTNLGHTDAAAGLAGLLKAALIVRHGEIPPHLHLREPNPNIDWAGWGLGVPEAAATVPWPGPDGAPRIAGVSAFGLSGSNAHVLLESPPRPSAAPPAGEAGSGSGTAREGRSCLVLPVSAKSGAALRQLAAAHRERLTALGQGAGGALEAYVATAATRRTHHAAHRLAVTGGDAAELAGELGAFLEAPEPAAPPQEAPAYEGTDPEGAGSGICFVFSGQGGQWPGMGLDLHAGEPAFREALDACEEVIREAAGWSVLAELRAEPDRSRLTDTEFAQPVIFAVQVALAALWRSWGVAPAAVAGHSMGELAAAHVAGALGLADAARIAVLRGRLLTAEAARGRMAAAALPRDEAAELAAPFGERLGLAAVNGPRSTVVSGEEAAVAEFADLVRAGGATCRLLPGGYAFHHPRLAPLGGELAARLADLRVEAARIPLFTTTPGPDGALPAQAPALDAGHWGRNVSSPVLFAPAVERMLAAGHLRFLEIGPHPVLAQPLAQCLEEAGLDGLLLPSLRRETDDVRTARASLAALYASGARIDWEAVGPRGGLSRDLPRYPWQGERLWFAGPAAAPAAAGPAGGVPELGALRGELRVFDAAGRLLGEVADLRLNPPAGGGEACGAAAAAGEAAPPPAGRTASPAGAAAGVAPRERAQDAPPGGSARAGAPRPGREALADLVAAHAAEVLGLSGGALPPRRQGFAELGMDSLGAVELARLLQRSLGVRVPKTAGFDHPTVERLAGYLDELLPAAPVPAPHEPAPRPQAAAPQAPVPAPVPAALPAPAPAPAEAQAPARDAAHAPAHAASRAPAAAEPLAVVGIGCRFPGGGTGPEGFWRMLREGVDAIGPVPEGRFGGSRVWQGGFLDGVDEFDAPFFRIPPREARVMDPQQRMFLEVAWEALEHAGQPPAALAGTRTGVFLGMNSTDYAQIVTSHPDNVDAFYGTGNSFTAAAGRLSYLLGVHGPSLAVDTACSSSLVAVHLAAASLRAGESEIALAGGVNLILSDTIHRSTSVSGALAADGRCKTFDAAADGYTRGEGCGVIVLKPLSRALADGDEVLALLLGSAVNQDGPSSGLTVPNGPAQEDLVRRALAAADVDPAEVGYVEAHGTGTPLGDPIELQALGGALGRREGREPCLVGSVKTNIGHLEAASGIAGLIKAVLALRHREIPPHLHFREPSPEIPWENLPLRVPTAPTPFARHGARRVAGVSAFGFSGTNAHVVLAEAPEPAARPPEPAAPPAPAARTALAARGASGMVALPLSAASRAALADRARAFADLLAGEGPDAEALGAEDPAAQEPSGAGRPGREPSGAGPAREPAAPDPADVAYTAALRRGHLDHRLVAVGRNGRELAARLRTFAEGGTGNGIAAGTAGEEPRHGPVFVFSGHGSYWRGMCRDLIAEDPIFRAAIERCDAALAPYLDWSVAGRLARAAELDDELDQQLLLFAVQYGLVAVWRALGVEPAAVVGHSMGEVSAALCAGALGLPEAARVMAHRTRLLRDLVGRGGMAVIGLDAEHTERELASFADRAWVSVVNSHRSTVVSGETAALAELEASLRRRNVFFRSVAAGGPAHSPLAEPLRVRLEERLSGLAAAPCAVPMYSSVTGRPVTEELDAGYWGRNLRLPVRFAEAVRALTADGHDTFVELSAHPLQLTPIEHELDAAGVNGGVLVPSLLREESSALTLLTAFGTLHARGRRVDWRALHPGGGRQADLPRYPWQHRRYWVEHDARPAAGAPAAVGRPGAAHPLLGREFETPGRVRLFETEIGAELADALGAGPVEGVRRLPAAGWLEMARAAAEREDRAHRLVDVLLPRPFAAFEAERCLAQLALEPRPGGEWAFTLHARPGEPAGEPFRVLASGRAVPGRGRPALAPGGARAHSAPDEALVSWSAAACTGGEAAPRAVSAWRGPDAVEVELACRPATQRWGLRPDVLEAALLLPRLLAGEAAAGFVPARIGSLAAFGPAGDAVRIGARLLPGAEGEVRADVWLSTPAGAPVAELREVCLAPAPGIALDPAEHRRLADSLYLLDWREVPAPEAAGHASSPAPVAASGTARESAAEAAGEAAAEAGEAGNRARTTGSWVVVCDRGGVGEALVRLLRERGDEVVPVTATAPGEVRERVTRALRAGAEGAAHRGVVHLAALDLPDALPEAGPDPAGLAEAAEAAASLLAASAAAFAVTGRSPAPARVHCVTRGAVAVFPGEPCAPLRAPVHRLAAVAGVERPPVWGGVLDLDPRPVPPGPLAAAGTGTETEAETAAATEAEAILAELTGWEAGPGGAGPAEDHLALRGGRRLAARVVRHPAPGPVLEPVALRRDRTYLVAGAEGELAARAADWLAARGAGRVVAAGRLAGGEHGKAGAPGENAAADAVTRLLKEAEGAGAPVGGVVWLGVDWRLDQPAAALPEAAELRKLLAERARGAWLLHEACAEEGLELDLFVLFGSVASLWGAAGACRQAAPDGLLAALAAHRAALGLPVCEVAWAPWDEVGLLDDASRALLTRSGLEPIPPGTGLRLLDLALAGQRGPVAAALADWSLLLPLYRQSLPWPLFDEMAAAGAATPDGAEELLARLRSLPPREHDELLLDCVLEEVAVVLGVESPADLDPAQGFFEIGMSSITSLELKVRLERRFGCELPATLAFEQPTSEAMARYLGTEVLGTADPAGAEPAPETDAAKAPPTDPAGADPGAGPGEEAGEGLVPGPADGAGGDELLALLDQEISAANDLIDRGRSH